jgi:phosphatidate phosphatase APP1
VLFYRGYASYSPVGDCWHLRVHGRVYAQARRNLGKRALMFILQRYVRPERSDGQQERFRERAKLFLQDHRPGKSIPVTIGQQAFRLPDTSEHGHFDAVVTVQAAELEPLALTLPDGRRFIRFSMELGEQDERLFTGEIELLKPEGISIISDVDDTIKVSNVANRQELLKNTFAREFQSVPGMSAIYRQWAAAGCSFHYVSASPWLLYEPLDQWLTADEFPAGSLHLRYVGLRELRRDKEGVGSWQAKRAAIEQLLRTFPYRRFVLCGDAGERDPELYATIGRSFGRQVARICIRQVSGRHHPSGISRAMIEQLDPLQPERWTIFESAEELAGLNLNSPTPGPAGE